MNLDQELKKYYSNKKLPDEKIKHIQSLGNQEKSAPLALSKIYASAGAFSLVALVAMVFLWAPVKQTQTLAVAKEVAKNHLKDLNSEIISSDYHEIQAKLDRLKFSIFPVKPFVQNQYQLVGGRYCSIQTELAAQINLQNEAGEHETLYIVPVKKFANVDEGVEFVKNVKVQIWKDQGRLFALAKTLKN